MRRNIASARAQSSAKYAEGIENNASVTDSHPLRGRSERSSISSNAESSGLYAAQTGTAMPVSETVAAIADHSTAVAGGKFTAARMAGTVKEQSAGQNQAGISAAVCAR